MTRRDDGPTVPDKAAVGIEGAPLGRCPDCDAAIPSTRLLIEYETTSGRSQFAECPACREVVHPREAT